MKLPAWLSQAIAADDARIGSGEISLFSQPKYDPATHYLELTRSPYYRALVVMRHYIKTTSDYYFGVEQQAKNLDLFMLTPSVSSPMGPGSDSEAIEIRFGNLTTYLVDSSQFGFEPLLMNSLDKVYCYLPSMRGEEPDNRHLNQFFHCEAEVVGTLEDLIPIIEDYIRRLSECLLSMPKILERTSVNYDRSIEALQDVVKTEHFARISFDEAASLLLATKTEGLVTVTDHGRDITSEGERRLFELVKSKTPIWLYNFDRDRVPFYQKPNPQSVNSVINADLLFPPLLVDSFSGEVAGAGQRQDNANEIRESIARQGLDAAPYEWYINLRDETSYKTTAGFGLGIERFITWALCRSDIKEAILYPRLKNVVTYP